MEKAKENKKEKVQIIYQIRCPICGRYLGELSGIAKLKCHYCKHQEVYIR